MRLLWTNSKKDINNWFYTSSEKMGEVTSLFVTDIDKRWDLKENLLEPHTLSEQYWKYSSLTNTYFDHWEA